MQKIIIKAETYQEFIDKILDIVFKEYEPRVQDCHRLLDIYNDTTNQKRFHVLCGKLIYTN